MLTLYPDFSCVSIGKLAFTSAELDTQMHILPMHNDEAHFPEAHFTNVLLNQQFSSIHHIPSGSSSQMDLNGHSESPVRRLIASLFLQRLTLLSKHLAEM